MQIYFDWPLNSHQLKLMSSFNSTLSIKAASRGNNLEKTLEPLTTDEIIEEIQVIRQEHAASFDFDIECIITDLKKSDRIHTEQG